MYHKFDVSKQRGNTGHRNPSQQLKPGKQQFRTTKLENAIAKAGALCSKVQQNRASTRALPQNSNNPASPSEARGLVFR